MAGVCSCRLWRCTENDEAALNTLPGPYWKANCGCRLYVCNEEARRPLQPWTTPQGSSSLALGTGNVLPRQSFNNADNIQPDIESSDPFMGHVPNEFDDTLFGTLFQSADTAAPGTIYGHQGLDRSSIPVHGQGSTIEQPLPANADESSAGVRPQSTKATETTSSGASDQPTVAEPSQSMQSHKRKRLHDSDRLDTSYSGRASQEMTSAENPDQTKTDVGDKSGATDRQPVSSPGSSPGSHDSAPGKSSKANSRSENDMTRPTAGWGSGRPNGFPRMGTQRGMPYRPRPTLSANESGSRSSCVYCNYPYSSTRCSTCTGFNPTASASLDSRSENRSCPSCRYRCRCGDSGLTSADPSIGPTSATSSTRGTMGSISPAASSTDLQWARYRDSSPYRRHRYNPPLHWTLNPKLPYPRFPFHHPQFNHPCDIRTPIPPRAAALHQAHLRPTLAVKRYTHGFVPPPRAALSPIRQDVPTLWLTLVGLVAIAVANTGRSVEVSLTLEVLISLVGYLAVFGTLRERRGRTRGRRIG